MPDFSGLKDTYWGVQPGTGYVPCGRGVYIDGPVAGNTVQTTAFLRENADAIYAGAANIVNFPTNVLFIPSEPAQPADFDVAKLYRERHQDAGVTMADTSKQVKVSFNQIAPAVSVNVALSKETITHGSESIQMIQVDKI
jgi:hypothetical protein